MRKRSAIAAILYVIAVILVISFGFLLWKDYTVHYPYGSAPFYLYVTERAIALLLPSGLCIAAGTAVKQAKKASLKMEKETEPFKNGSYMKTKRIFFSIIIIAALCMLTACAYNPFTYTGGGTDIGGMFHDISSGEKQEELSFSLDIKNDTSVELYSAAISWYVDGEVVGSRGALNAADNYLLLPGQVITCKFLADDFPNGELSEVKIDVFVKEGPGDVDFVSCGTLIIPSPVYGQDYPVRLAEDETSDETYFLVSGDESLCLVETQQQAESQTVGSINLTGPWHLDETRNDLSLLTSTEMMDIFPVSRVLPNGVPAWKSAATAL